MNIIVYLEDTTAAFRVSDTQFNRLSRLFPDFNFQKVSDTQTFLQLLPQAEIVITWFFNADWYQHAFKLKAIFTPSAGHDRIARSTKFTVPVFHGSFHGPIMAESLLAMILYFNRRIKQAVTQQRDHIWNRDFLSTTSRLGSQHVVLVGYGNIARECARVLKTFGCRITAVKRSKRNLLLDKDADCVCHPKELKQILGTCDHLVSILPAEKETDNYFNKDIICALKPGSYFYSIGRGNSYTESDILWALSEGIIAGAGLDVFYQEPLPKESKLWDHPDILVFPHGTAIINDYLSLYFDELSNILKAFTAT